jgi:hypothetical protein
MAVIESCDEWQKFLFFRRRRGFLLIIGNDVLQKLHKFIYSGVVCKVDSIWRNAERSFNF